MKIAIKIWIAGWLILFCWGCASSPDIVSQNCAKDERYSADYIRRVTVDQPFLISGDYFRERDQKNTLRLNLSFSEE